jgi:hypothetical protein
MRELSVAEQRYQAVVAVIGDGLSRGGIEAYRFVVKVGREEPYIVIERRRSRSAW